MRAVRQRLAEVAPHFATVSNASVEAPSWLNGEYRKGVAELVKAAKAGGAQAAALQSPVDNFFMTDVVSRASQTMAKCVLARQTMKY